MALRRSARPLLLYKIQIKNKSERTLKKKYVRICLVWCRKYERIQLMQLPVAFLFGYLTDFGVWALEKVVCRTYWQQWLACLAGIILVAVGVSLEVKADVVVLAGEGVVLAICKVLPVKFGFMKVGFDITLVIIACLLSLSILGTLQGVREGTVAAAIFVGLLAKRFGKWMKGWDLEGTQKNEIR